MKTLHGNQKDLEKRYFCQTCTMKFLLTKTSTFFKLASTASSPYPLDFGSGRTCTTCIHAFPEWLTADIITGMFELHKEDSIILSLGAPTIICTFMHSSLHRQIFGPAFLWATSLRPLVFYQFD